METANPTHISFILDESGSMMYARDATVSAFNEYVEGLRGRDLPITFGLTRFNSARIEVGEMGVNVSDVPPLTDETYVPNVATPLYDAIATAIGSTERFVEALEPKPAVVCDILTDGIENASTVCTRQMVFDLISRKQAEGWTFAYMAADQDAWVVGESIGIPGRNTARFSRQNPGSAMNRKLAAMRRHIDRGAKVASEGFYNSEERDSGSPS